jgi:hypothetical protein
MVEVIVSIIAVGAVLFCFQLGRQFEHRKPPLPPSLPIPPPVVAAPTASTDPESAYLVMEAMQWNAKVDSIPIIQRTPIPEQETRQ